MNIYLTISDEPVYETKAKQREIALSLLSRALEREFGVKREHLEYGGEIVRGEHGKPYFRGNSGIHFNYSHCKYGAVCAVGNSAVGVDIQEIRKVRPSLIERVCCDNELKTIKNDSDFIRIWTLKEAYVKFTGEGISRGFAGLKAIDTTVILGGIAVRRGVCYVAGYSEGEMVVVDD